MYHCIDIPKERSMGMLNISLNCNQTLLLDVLLVKFP